MNKNEINLDRSTRSVSYPDMDGPFCSHLYILKFDPFKLLHSFGSKLRMSENYSEVVPFSSAGSMTKTIMNAD